MKSTEDKIRPYVSRADFEEARELDLWEYPVYLRLREAGHTHEHAMSESNNFPSYHADSYDELQSHIADDIFNLSLDEDVPSIPELKKSYKMITFDGKYWDEFDDLTECFFVGYIK